MEAAIERAFRRFGRRYSWMFYGWISIVAFATAAVVLGAFALWERHTDEPMLDLRLFRNPAFSTGTGGMMLVFLALYGVMFGTGAK